MSKFEVSVDLNLKHIFELLVLYTTGYWSKLDYHLITNFGEKAKIKKVGNLN